MLCDGSFTWKFLKFKLNLPIVSLRWLPKYELNKDDTKGQAKVKQQQKKTHEASTLHAEL